MSVDLEHKLIYELCVEPVIVFGDKVIGKKAVHIYEEEDGTYLITEHTEASDLDPRDCHSITITRPMLAAMMPARPEKILEAAFVVKGGALPDWEYVAKAFFKTEKHLTADQAWFDFQAKAQRFLEVLKAEMPLQPIPTPDEAFSQKAAKILADIRAGKHHVDPRDIGKMLDRKFDQDFVTWLLEVAALSRARRDAALEKAALWFMSYDNGSVPGKDIPPAFEMYAEFACHISARSPAPTCVDDAKDSA